MVDTTHSPANLWRERILVMCGALLFGLAFSAPLLEHLGESYSVDDWDHWRDFDWVSLYIVNHFHQFPLWSPYQCGGIQILANPQSRILTPFFVLHLLVGSTTGINLEVPLHLAIGWAGGYVLVRALGLGRSAAVTCATVFPSSSWFYLHFGAGALDFLSFAYSPWIIACWWLSVERRRLAWSAAAGALLALSFFDGATYTIAETGLALAVLTPIVALKSRNIWPVYALLTAATFTVGFSAPKLLPTWYLAMQHSRATAPDQEYLSVVGYLTAFFSRHQDGQTFLQWSTVGFQPLFQCGAYLSPPFLFLAATGIYCSFRRCLPWLALVVVFGALGMGNYFGPNSPWVLLHHLPLFGWLQVSPKFFVMLVLAFGVIAAYGSESLSRSRPPFGGVALVALVTAGVVDTWLIGPPNLFHAVQPVDPLPASAGFRQYQDTSDHTMLRVNRAGMGITNCYVYMAVSNRVAASNRPGYHGEQYLLGSGSVTLTRWRPESLAFDVALPSPTVLVINQNYDSFWTLTRGTGRVKSYDGLLALDLPAGRQRIELGYSDYQFLAEVIVSLLTLVASLVIAGVSSHSQSWFGQLAKQEPAMRRCSRSTQCRRPRYGSPR